MAARLSWSIDKTKLILTVTDGPKTSHYTLARSGSHEAQRATLAAVLGDMGGSVPAPLAKGVSDIPVPLQGIIRTTQPETLHSYRGGIAEEPEAGVVAPPMTEEESLEQLKQRAYEFAQKNLGFARGDIPDDTAARLVRAPAHSTFGQNPGYPTLEGGGVAAVDGTFIDPSQFREKPRYNVENHED